VVSFDFIRGFTEEYGSAVESVEAYAADAEERIKRETAALLRPDGTPRYTPEEHAERQAAIVEAATAEFDRLTARNVRQAEEAAAACTRELTMLGGSDPLDSLSDAERQQAASRREFVREDVECLPPTQLAARIRTVIEGGDKVASVLYARYLRDRDGATIPALRDATNELEAPLGIDQQGDRRRELMESVRRHEALVVAVESTRRRADGSNARMMAQMRRQYGATV
jgi:hypothetical protein